MRNPEFILCKRRDLSGGIERIQILVRGEDLWYCVSGMDGCVKERIEWVFVTRVVPVPGPE